jgi:hypothetical protein
MRIRVHLTLQVATTTRRVRAARLARTAAALLLGVAAGLLCPACGSIGAPAGPAPVATPSATPTPPDPAPRAASGCALTAPKIDCATRVVNTPDLNNDLQEAIDAAARTGSVMYSDDPNRIYDLLQFRQIVVSTLGAKGMCGAWDYGNESGDEIYVRSADGCVTEQYDLITGDGGVRPAKKSSMMWQDGWGPAVPAAKPAFSKEGDLSCTLPGDRSTFCLSIKNSPGEYGRAVYDLMAQVLNENPGLFDAGDHLKGRGEGNADQLRLPAWRIVDVDGYIAKIEAKLRANGFCGFVEKGDILKVKKVSRGNILHEEIDVVENPPSGGAYVSFAVKDRCHDAGF